MEVISAWKHQWTIKFPCPLSTPSTALAGYQQEAQQWMPSVVLRNDSYRLWGIQFAATMVCMVMWNQHGMSCVHSCFINRSPLTTMELAGLWVGKPLQTLTLNKRGYGINKLMQWWKDNSSRPLAAPGTEGAPGAGDWYEMLGFKAPERRRKKQGRGLWVGITQQPLWSWKPVKSAWPLHDTGDKAGGKGERRAQMYKKVQIESSLLKANISHSATRSQRSFDVLPDFHSPLREGWTIGVVSDSTRLKTLRGHRHVWTHSAQQPTRAAPFSEVCFSAFRCLHRLIVSWNTAAPWFLSDHWNNYVFVSCGYIVPHIWLPQFFIFFCNYPLRCVVELTNL